MGLQIDVRDVTKRNDVERFKEDNNNNERDSAINGDF